MTSEDDDDNIDLNDKHVKKDKEMDEIVQNFKDKEMDEMVQNFLKSNPDL